MIVIRQNYFIVWFMAGGAVTGDDSGLSGVTLFLELLKVAILVLSIIDAVHYKDDSRVGAAPSILLIVGGAISLIPLLEWAGGIFTIVGGSLYLAKLKHFSENN